MATPIKATEQRNFAVSDVSFDKVNFVVSDVTFDKVLQVAEQHGMDTLFSWSLCHKHYLSRILCDQKDSM
jgi:hypothetical protein